MWFYVGVDVCEHTTVKWCRVDTNETATSVLEHQSHAAGNEAIVEEDEGTEAGASALSGKVTTAGQSADSNMVGLNGMNSKVVWTITEWLMLWNFLTDRYK